MSLATRISVDTEAWVWAASYDGRKGAFRVAMADGRIYLLHRPIPEDDGSEVMDVFLEGDGEVFTVVQASGNEFSVPWDAVANLIGGSPEATDSGTSRRIGRRIRALRRERHLTQAQFGRMAGLQRPNISRLEAGTHLPSLLSIQRVADALGVTVSDIVAMPTM